MPMYEYRCAGCRRRSTVLVRSMSDAPQVSCRHCGGGNMTRLISKFSFHRSWGESLNWAPDSGYPDPDHDDPKQMADWMRRMRTEMGDEVGPEFDEMVEELETEAAGPLDDGDDF